MTQEDFVDVLRDRRHAMGLTLADLDHVAGFHGGYASHLEKPFTRSGKRSFKLTEMGAIWLQALGLRLLIEPVRECTSSALGGNENPPSVETGNATATLSSSLGKRRR